MLIEEFNKLSNYKQLSVIFNSTPITKVANIYGKAIEINTNIYLYLGKHKIRLYKSNINMCALACILFLLNKLII